MPKWPVPVFCCFLVPGELKNKYSPNWKRKLFYEVLHRKTPEARRGAAGGPQGAHTWPSRALALLAAPGLGVAHLGRLRLRLFAYLITPDGKTLNIAKKVQKEVRSRRHRRREI